MRYLMFIVLFALNSMMLNAYPVGGWINEDTVWTLDNSPYVVESYLYVAEDVTLSIEPGVEVLVMGGNISGNWDDFRWSGTVDNPVEPIAKRIIVHGKISAYGTELAPVIFDTFEPDPLYNWSGIEFVAGAPKSEFEYCMFKRTFLAYPFQSTSARWGALSIRNGWIHIRNCEFNMNWVAITTYPPGIQEDTVIYGCKFYAENLAYYTFPPSFINVISDIQPEPLLTIARCEFRGEAKDLHCYYVKNFMLFNKYIDYTDTEARVQDIVRVTMTTTFYGNESENSRVKLICYNDTESDSIFFRRNSIIYDNNSTDYAELILSCPESGTFSDNYVRGNIKTTFSPKAQVYNNVFELAYRFVDPIILYGNNNPPVLDLPSVYNNLLRDIYPSQSVLHIAIKSMGNTPMIFNNTIIGFSNINGNTQANPRFFNNIFDGNNYLSPGSGYVYQQVFFNNCLEMPFLYEPYPYDGGGNIIAAPLYADSLGGDFSLQEGSPCIDTGLNIPELPAFDIRYHKRVASGTATGPQTVDMGAYEYNSVYIGGIRGYVYDAATFAPLDCARIDIDGRLPEFSDQNGRFPFPTGAGIYTLRVSRWDYEDLIIPNVVVTEGEDIRVNFAMNSLTTASGDVTNPPLGDQLALMNYPNPFRQETRIGFVLTEMGPVRLTVYNLRGQKIRSLADLSLAKGHHSLTWDGKDDSGRSASQGIYFIRLDNGSRHAMQKMVLMR